MNIYRNLNKSYEQYEVGGTDFIVEICDEPLEKEYIEVWLYRKGYGVKQLMFCIKKEDNYKEIIEKNVAEYIEEYLEEVE